MTKEFAKIVKQTSTNPQQVFNPKKFRYKLIQFAPQFTLGNQHDSQQFINFLLDALHEDLNEIKEKPYIQGIPSNGRQDEEVSLECWDKHLRRNKSFIVDLMHGQLKQTLKCDVCSQTQVTFDPFQMFCVEIPKQQRNTFEQINLKNCFRFLQREEHLEGMNQFYCEACNNHVNGTKSINLYKAPEIFIVYLKRFIQNGYSIIKNNMSVNYPLELNLKEFLPESYKKQTIYDLYAVNIHSGTVGGGHYYAYAKVDEEWYEFNDSLVESCSNAQTSNAYVLFYQKRS